MQSKVLLISSSLGIEWNYGNYASHDETRVELRLFKYYLGRLSASYCMESLMARQSPFIKILSRFYPDFIQILYR